MNQHAIPESRAAEAAQISAAVDKFLSGGGSIQRLGIRIGDPKTPDSWRAYRDTAEMPVNRTAQPKRRMQDTQIKAKSRSKRLDRDAIAPEIKRLSESGMTTSEIVRTIGRSRKMVVMAAEENGIKLNGRVGNPPSITEQVVRSVRADHREGLTYEAMAVKHGLHRSTVRDIVTYKTHKAVR